MDSNEKLYPARLSWQLSSTIENVVHLFMGSINCREPHWEVGIAMGRCGIPVPALCESYRDGLNLLLRKREKRGFGGFGAIVVRLCLLSGIRTTDAKSTAT